MCEDKEKSLIDAFKKCIDSLLELQTHEIELGPMILSIDLKLKLKRPVQGKEFIQYDNLTEDMEPELFNKIIEAVSNSLNKNIYE